MDRANERLTAHLSLLREAEQGRLDELQCPHCGNLSVSVWFTQPCSGVYRTWLVCAGCDFHTRAQNTDRPRYFSDARLRADLEERDKPVLDQLKTHRPK